MATVINGILNQRLPWRLVLMGCAGDCGGDTWSALAGLCDRVVPFHCHDGSDVCGGLIAGRWKSQPRKKMKATRARRVVLFRIDRGGRRVWTAGHRFASGGGRGETRKLSGSAARLAGLWAKHWVRWRSTKKLAMPTQAQSLLGVLMFGLLAASLFYFARKKLD